MNVLKTRLDVNVARGARVKALAIGSRHKATLEPLSKFLEASLDSVFQVQQTNASLEVNMSKSLMVIEDMYIQIGQLESGMQSVGNYM